MTGIVGIAKSGCGTEVAQMLETISHRGEDGKAILEFDDATLGVVWTNSKEPPIVDVTQEQVVRDYAGDGHFASAQVIDEGVKLTRDRMGVAPLYYGQVGGDSTLCFASEAKGLLEVSQEVRELPPGHHFNGDHLKPYFHLKKKPPLDASPDHIAEELHQRLAEAVSKRINGKKEMGAWLSGGLDSSTMAALAQSHLDTLYTFAIGLNNAPDIKNARIVAKFLQTDHHEIIVEMDELLAVLSDVIYQLESFDALLVRSSLTNYLVAKAASRYVPAVFSGEGGDELFAGYAYLKSLNPSALPDELIDIAQRLHNTALQRVDRCASAHGTVAHVGFLDPAVVDYALQIPTNLKLRNGVEKWILRKAMKGLLPEEVLNRTKSKFWEGAGVVNLMAQFAGRQISDREFARKRTLPNGWQLNTKEELMYYLIFREHFGELDDLSWMGRTKGAPIS